MSLPQDVDPERARKADSVFLAYLERMSLPEHWAAFVEATVAKALAVIAEDPEATLAWESLGEHGQQSAAEAMRVAAGCALGQMTRDVVEMTR